MNKTMRQGLAIFLMLWLPLFSGNALAMTPCPHAMSQDMSMATDDPAGHCNMHKEPQQQNGHGCDQCAQCHVACSPGITSSLLASATTASSAEHATLPILFRSITLPLFDPPPLVLI